MKQLMEQYNICALISSEQQQLTLPQVLDTTSQFCRLDSHLNVQSYESDPVPLDTKQDLIHFYLQKNRSLEEIQLLQHEMLNTLEYFRMKAVTIKQKVQELLQGEQTDIVRGSISVLSQRYVEIEFILKQAVATFAAIVPIPTDVLALCQPDPVCPSNDFYDTDESSDDDT